MYPTLVKASSDGNSPTGPPVVVQERVRPNVESKLNVWALSPTLQSRGRHGEDHSFGLQPLHPRDRFLILGIIDYASSKISSYLEKKSQAQLITQDTGTGVRCCIHIVILTTEFAFR